MISVIIPTLNAAHELPSLLASISEETIGDMEILVIDSSSDDNTAQVAIEFGAKVLTLPRADFDHGGARTYGAKQAGGEYLVYLSQDVVPVSEDALRTLVHTFDTDSDIAAVYGRQLPQKGASFFASCLRRFNYPEQSHVRTIDDRSMFGLKTAFLSNSFSAYRKTHLSQIGFFKQRIIFGEDMHAAARLLLNEKKIAYCAQAQVYHSHNYSIAQDFKRYFDMGVFHGLEKPLLREFGNPEKQAGNYLRFELSCLICNKKYYLFPELVLRQIAKIIGYLIGKRHRWIPKWLKRRIGMNHAWWRFEDD